MRKVTIHMNLPNFLKEYTHTFYVNDNVSNQQIANIVKEKTEAICSYDIEDHYGDFTEITYGKQYRNK